MVESTVEEDTMGGSFLKICLYFMDFGRDIEYSNFSLWIRDTCQFACATYAIQDLVPLLAIVTVQVNLC